MRSSKGNLHPNHKYRDEKYKRQAIIDIEFDFSNTPDWIARIESKAQNYIQYGVLYSYTSYYGSLKTTTMFGDSRQVLNNRQFDFIKINKKLWAITNDHTILIENVIR